MKKILLAALCGLLLCSCGVGSYSVSSGKADEGMLSFVSASKMAVTVNVDGNCFNISTVKAKAWRKDRDIRRTAQNTIYLTPGQHEVVVSIEGDEVYHKKLFISAQEHRVVEL